MLIQKRLLPCVMSAISGLSDEVATIWTAINAKAASSDLSQKANQTTVDALTTVVAGKAGSGTVSALSTALDALTSTVNTLSTAFSAFTARFKSKRVALSYGFILTALYTDVVITLDSAFADTNYTVILTLEIPGAVTIPLAAIVRAKTTSSITVRVSAASVLSGTTTGTIHALLFHD